MNAEMKTARPPDGAAMPAHHDGKNPRMKTTIFVALLLLGLLAGGTWAGAQTPENGTLVEEAHRTEQPRDQNGPPAPGGDIPARLHPRGLPRRIIRLGQRQVAGSGSEPVTRAPQRGERT